jgi:hypothetical protein
MMRAFLLLVWCASLGLRAAAETNAPAPAADNTDAPALKLPEPQTRPAAGEGAPGNFPAAAPEQTATNAAPADAAGAPSPDETPAAENTLLPPAFPLSRYEPLWKRSPFQLESVAPPVASEGLAQRYALTGIAEINGDPIAFLLERATQTRHMIDRQEDPSGLSLLTVDVAKNYNESTVTVRMGSEVGVIKFDAAAAVQGAVPPGMAGGMIRAPQIPVPGVPMPGAVPGMPPAVPPVQAQTAPGIVPPVPGPGVPPEGQVQAPDAQGNMPPPRVIRRRALIPAAP